MQEITISFLKRRFTKLQYTLHLNTEYFIQGNIKFSIYFHIPLNKEGT